MNMLKKLYRQLSWNRRYTLKDVSLHCTCESCWVIIDDKVYDLTNFIEHHPGGSEIILEFAGHDATTAFTQKPHSQEAILNLENYYIGDLIQEKQ